MAIRSGGPCSMRTPPVKQYRCGESMSLCALRRDSRVRLATIPARALAHTNFSVRCQTVELPLLTGPSRAHNVSEALDLYSPGTGCAFIGFANQKATEFPCA